MSFHTPESAEAELREKIANIDPNRKYRTSEGFVFGSELRAQMEKTVRYRGVDLPPRKVTS